MLVDRDELCGARPQNTASMAPDVAPTPTRERPHFLLLVFHPWTGPTDLRWPRLGLRQTAVTITERGKKSNQ